MSVRTCFVQQTRFDAAGWKVYWDPLFSKHSSRASTVGGVVDVVVVLVVATTRVTNSNAFPIRNFSQSELIGPAKF